MKAYKLTDENGRTKNNTQWGENVTHTTKGTGTKLCSDGWIHFYTDPYLAVIMNPKHADFRNPLLWECETSGEHLHEPLKSGCKILTTTKQIPLPVISTKGKVIFAILCGKQVYKHPKWNEWANNWLNRKDKSRNAAYAADAAYAAAAAAAAADAYAADAYAADAAYAAAYAAAAAAAADAYAAYAADAAYAAAAAADADADAYAADATSINFPSLIQQALSLEATEVEKSQ